MVMYVYCARCMYVWVCVCVCTCDFPDYLLPLFLSWCSRWDFNRPQDWLIPLFTPSESPPVPPCCVTLPVPKSQWAPCKLSTLYSSAKKDSSLYQWDFRSLELTNQSASLVTPWTNQLVSLDPQGANWCLFCANNDSNNDKASSTSLPLLTDRRAHFLVPKKEGKGYVTQTNQLKLNLIRSYDKENKKKLCKL